MGLSTRPDKYIGEISVWNESEMMIAKALNKFGREYKRNEGDGAFYGPKIDIDLQDAYGRNH